MKTIYKEPKRLGKANQMENIHKLNTTGSLRRIYEQYSNHWGLGILQR